MSNRHARISMSGATRWSNCTKSTELVKLVPAPEESIYAKEGTEAHETLSKIIDEYFIKKVITDWKVSKNYLPEFEELLSFIKSLGKNLKIFTEAKVTWLGVTGTSDIIVLDLDKKIVYVLDLKWGQGKFVQAYHNDQLQAYGRGVIETILKKALEQDIVNYKFVLGIYQPRIERDEDEDLSPLELWELSYEELLENSKHIEDAIELIRKGQVEYKAGSWCSWCPAIGICPKKHEYFKQVEVSRSKLPDVGSLTIDQLDDIVAVAPEVIKWLGEAKDLAYRYAISGHKFKKVKLVPGISKRRWVDDTVVAKEMISMGIDPFNQKLIGIGDAEKQLKSIGVKAIPPSWTIKPEASPSLVPIEDKRAAIEVSSPEDIFSDDIK